MVRWLHLVSSQLPKHERTGIALVLRQSLHQTLVEKVSCIALGYLKAALSQTQVHQECSEVITGLTSALEPERRSHQELTSYSWKAASNSNDHSPRSAAFL
jgi:hypothetical protein